MDLETVTAADFEGRLRDRFRLVHDASEPSEIELVEVTELPRAPGGRAPFSLIFQGGLDPPLPQRIYRLEHEQLGAIEIFLVPIAADRYEAVFT